MASTKDKVSDLRPYIERALKDQEVRDNVRSAVETARDVYGQLFGGRSATALAARLATDEDIQTELKKAVADLREAADRIRGKEDHTARNTMLLLVGVALGVFFNPFTGETARNWVKEKLFGPEQDFTYQDQSDNSR